MKTTRIHRAVLPGVLAFLAVSGPAFAADWAKDSAYYTNMQKDLYAKARANSTAAKEAQIRQQARASAECNDLKVASQDAGRRYAEVHMAPDPTKVIDNNTCFIDVQSIQIPSTGFGFADQLLKNFLGNQLRQCGNTIGSWGRMVTAVQSGNWNTVAGLSLQQYTGQRTNLSPVEGLLVGAGGTYANGQDVGAYVGQQAGNYVGQQAGSYINQRTDSRIGQQVGGYVSREAGGYISQQTPGQAMPASGVRTGASTSQPSFAERIWGKLTGPSQ